MMLNFERGNQANPKGHAIAYLRNVNNRDEVYATYLVVPPIAIDLTKYMPPLFSGNVSMADMGSISAIPLPPIPEKVAGVGMLKVLAEGRDDDMINLGTADTVDVQGMLSLTGEAAQEYLRSYQVHASTLPIPAIAEEGPALSNPESVEDVLFSLMGDRDKLSELAKLLGKLRYAIDSGDTSLANDASAEVESAAAHMPAKFHIQAVIESAKRPGDKGRKLLELQLTRCYKLCDEDYRAVETLEAQIKAFDA